MFYKEQGPRGHAFISREEALRRRGRGDGSPNVVRALNTPRPKPVISEWEAEAYADLRLNDLIESARVAGFSVGGRPKAIETMREHILKREIPLRYTVIPD